MATLSASILGSTIFCGLNHADFALLKLKNSLRSPILSSSSKLSCFNAPLDAPIRKKLLRNSRLFTNASDQTVTENEEKVSDEEVNSSDEEATQSSVPSPVSQFAQRMRNLVQDNTEESWSAFEAELCSIYKSNLELDQKASVITDEANLAKERLLRLNADFDNFRKRSEREKISMASTVRGDVIEELLPMIDNFERAKTALKIESEAEQKIDASYQGIYRQFVEIMKNLGVSAVDTVGKEFDPMFHEAIMREESSEYNEGVVIQEFRKGFKIGDKLLRPAMVKVSSGPGLIQAPEPTQSEAGVQSSPEQSESSSEEKPPTPSTE